MRFWRQESYVVAAARVATTCLATWRQGVAKLILGDSGLKRLACLELRFATGATVCRGCHLLAMRELCLFCVRLQGRTASADALPWRWARGETGELSKN